MLKWLKRTLGVAKPEYREQPEEGGLTTSLITQVIIGAVAFILIGVAIGFGPTMLSGFETMRTADNVSEYTGLSSVIEFGPTAILLGFIIMVGIVGFLGIKMAGKGKA